MPFSFITCVRTHTHICTHIHTSHVCASKLSLILVHKLTLNICSHTLTHTPLTHEYPYAHAAHTCLHAYTCMLIYTCTHRMPFTLQPEKLRCTTVGVSAACKVTWPPECALRPRDALSVIRDASLSLPRPEQRSSAHARIPFQQDSAPLPRV